ncbi:c-type cytochrome [Asanoa sp. WMMD1127]|uniref:cytochrome bc1 complex diheme cytochrome c subunit n=1 Tax=Asanoa sp. WMMD1127 TaxID=3016107 RepID=UPI0024166A94|nr:c-type cytochrome [Asanoa sp. WMMD1127]MDG4827176.1 c-type cytochrome [Asanoa sp. WMMD1127]
MTSPHRSGGLLARMRRRRAVPRSKARRRIASATRLLAALVLAGGLYTAFAPAISAEDAPLSPAAMEGKELFDNSCITCHGSGGEGIQGRGPSLVGVGAASVEFQVGTGRMPLGSQSAQAIEKPPVFNEEQTRQIAQYVQELGGGPDLPEGTDLRSGGDVAVGGEIFRLNCSQCHAFGGGGGALSSGKFAPRLSDTTDRVIWAAMLSGPQNMPVFGDNQLTPDEKRDVIAYIQDTLKENDPGGFNLGRLGPTTEGLAVFVVGMTALIFTALWIAGKS